MSLPRPLVSPAELEPRLGREELVVLDASWYLPNAGRDAAAEYRAARIPGARFFDISRVVDPSTDLPHMAPPPAQLAEALEALGVGGDSEVVVYDGLGVFSAPRVWWLLRAFGKAEVSVLDGGFPRWRREGRPVESVPDPAIPRPPKRPFEPTRLEAWHADRDRIRAGLAESPTTQIVDARPGERFRGEAPEPRAGLRKGHIPGSCNLPWRSLLTEQNTLQPPEVLRARFADLGVDLDRPLITTCGSGITAAIASLAVEVLGGQSALYDGSWAEWGRTSEA